MYVLPEIIQQHDDGLCLVQAVILLLGGSTLPVIHICLRIPHQAFMYTPLIELHPTANPILYLSCLSGKQCLGEYDMIKY